MSLLNTFS